MTRSLGILLGVSIAAGLLVAGVATARPTVEVGPDVPVTLIADRAPPGTLVRLLPGTHRPFRLRSSVIVEALPGATVMGPVEILADDVRLRGLRIAGGRDGVTVERSEGVVLEDLAIEGTMLHGIHVADGSVVVAGCVIEGLTSPFAQAFEIRNSNGRPRSVVEGCTVSSGQEGLVSHVSRVEFRENRVHGTTLRAIAVTEMSEGLVEGNLVEDVAGSALYCGDMSHCDVRENEVRGVAPNPEAGKSHAGYPAVAWYYSRMRLAGNSLQGSAPSPVRLSIGSSLTDQPPMAIWPGGWSGAALPWLGVSAAAVAGLLVVRAAVAPWWSRRRERASVAARAPSRRVRDVLVVGFLVQTFHMLEHGVQVFQVYVADAEVRSGLLGSMVDTEWVHFAYNLGVLVFLVWAWWILRPSIGSATASSFAFLLTAIVVQTYHQVEHTTKIVQHVARGLDPSPGIIGNVADLVWFHYGINLTVYLGMGIALLPWLREWVRDLRGSERVDLRPRTLHPQAVEDGLEVR